MTADAQRTFEQALHQLPLVAILRGLTPAEAPAIGEVLTGEGFAMIEVPLNSPAPLDSIARLAAAHPKALVGAGTVLTVQEVQSVHAAGGRLVVSPCFDAQVVRAALDLEMVCLPGVLSPTEAFAALRAGAQGLKLFPAEMTPPAVVKALRAVIPPQVALLPVGGVSPQNLGAYRGAGASGAGLGSALYRPGDDAARVQLQARAFVQAWRDAGPVH
ncbi:MAG: 2-dehydro-3-deoxy-6-phosphogalactonate aldolase [Pseudomonadota bacterium]